MMFQIATWLSRLLNDCSCLSCLSHDCQHCQMIVRKKLYSAKPKMIRYTAGCSTFFLWTFKRLNLQGVPISVVGTAQVRLDVEIMNKHCQRHNGPEGWVLLTKVTSLGRITNSYTNLDQTSSEFRRSTNFKISIKHQHFYKLKLKNLDQT